MTEFQIISQFNSFLISNAMYLAVFTFLLWMAFRGVIRLSENGGTIFNKVLSSLFSLTVVYFNLQTLGFLYANLSPTAESFVNFVGGGSLDGFSLIPADPIAIIFWIVVLISLLVPTWTAPEPK